MYSYYRHRGSKTFFHRHVSILYTLKNSKLVLYIIWYVILCERASVGVNLCVYAYLVLSDKKSHKK